MTDPSRIRVSGPLQPFAARVAVELSRQGYTPHSVVSQLRLMAHVSRWLTDERLDLDIAHMGAAVPSVAGWRLANMPKGLEPAQVGSLLASCDRRTRHGRRDFAILTTLVRLGLRAGEFAGLRLDDINWRAGELVAHGKGNRADRLPLPSDVGDAVAAYLRRGRPASAQGRTVFVRRKAPHRALSTGGVSQVVAAAARRAGFEPIHAHRLRYTAATQLLRAGASLSEIGQLLPHCRPLTTAIYAKVDREGLRTIARTWPGGVS
jgi:site-specific recombinase XerD